MNGDIYAEWLIKKKPESYVKLLKVLMIAFFAIGVAFLLLVPAIGFVVFALSAGLLFFGYKRLDVEYEYIFVTTELSIDRILGQTSRKRKVLIDVTKMEIMAPMDSHELKGFMANPHVKKVDYSSKMPDAKTYGIYMSGSEGKVLYIIEPNEQILKAIRSVVPRKVIL